MTSVLFLQPPSPPGMDIIRDYAGGFGVAARTERNDYGHGKFSLPHVSLMYSAAVLREQGYDIMYVDAQAERLNAEDTIARVCGVRPDVIIATVNLPSIYADGHFLQRLKSRCSGSKLISIGTVCQVLPEVLGGMNAVDIVVSNEPESVLPNLVKCLHEESSIAKIAGIGIVQDGQLTKTKPSSRKVCLENLPWPPHDIMPTRRYRDPFFGAMARFFPIWGSRGCPMPCSFYCPYPIGMGRTIRVRPGDDLVAEMVHLYRDFHVKAFMFRDQVFSAREDRAIEICDLLMDRKLRIQWECETRFDMVSKRLLRKMKKAGCRRIDFGLETGDPSLLREIGKPGMDMSTVKKAVSMTKEAGIRPLTHLVLGLPGESPATVQKTLETLRDLGISNISVNLATPYPGTPLFQYAKKHELLESEDWSRYTSFDAVMRTEQMSAMELQESKESLARNLFGNTLFEKAVYLCRNKAIIDAMRTNLLRISHERSSLFGSVRRFFSSDIAASEKKEHVSNRRIH